MRDNLFYKIMAFLDKIVFTIVFRPKVIGRENIPKTGKCVVAGNHTKFLDPVMMVAYSKRQFHFLAKKELFDGILRPFMKGMGCISVNRKVRDKNVYVNANSVLEHDGVVAIFPEGTINRTDDTIMKFKIGAVKMAYDNDCVIVPFTITGKYTLFGIGNRIKLEYLKPIKVTKDLEKSNEKLMSIIKKKLEDENEKK